MKEGTQRRKFPGVRHMRDVVSPTPKKAPWPGARGAKTRALGQNVTDEEKTLPLPSGARGQGNKPTNQPRTGIGWKFQPFSVQKARVGNLKGRKPETRSLALLGAYSLGSWGTKGQGG